ncbi:DUF2059 domain-containing protein [Gilvimarinus agarilyticus]|uniref:DUF2059 domain-containing protein n=1 Tax=unclassified Gilvimarinus TaxID=2642066 RepID=UPI001C091DFC|nr:MULTISPECIES: DUF2059 domain-containing protein [unclassified Gilvimarinus]MBU2885152.1 DUF2059 domain-containing protein [Gilvimarinus agarilyticus]MDO6570050.1 DUF2059 domain-containing protein [Gilvimarinus sp. 2_MG-2023]MDO6747317.1 DUF2059 domain-containing protein [Gilvimarinus sp. 1_MG-2023]
MKSVIVLLLSMVVSVGAIAEESKRESVEELLRASNADALVDNIYVQFDQMLSGMKAQMGIKPSEEEIFDKHMQKIVDLMREEMSWAKLKEPMIDIYLEHYTEQEVQDMLAFYSSETGQSMVAKMPAVMNDSVQLSQGMMQSFMPKIQQLGQDLQTELEAHREAEQSQ